MNWIDVFSYITLFLYVIAIVYISIYCLFQIQLLYFYKKTFRKDKEPSKLRYFPNVTIQLPIFNEKFVVSRLLDSIAKLDYPKNKLQIQVLDDSTDETIQYTQKAVSKLKSEGFDIELIHRIDRKGYKAGALQNGLKNVKGDFIAIFDADFIAKKNFLKSTIPYFEDRNVGAVQTRWEHLNESYSVLTRIQALQLNMHFSVEQKGRDNGNFFLQFNGTAGLWRKSTIHDAGGWHTDTLTEDLDLSYRAQLKGWRIKFLEHLGAPAELPAEISGYKSQQYRWMKGGAETARKLLPTIWKSNLRISQKLQGSFHLLGSTNFIFIFLLGVLSFPTFLAFNHLEMDSKYLSIFALTSFCIGVLYYIANVQNAYVGESQSFFHKLIKFIFFFPLFLSLSMGLSFHNSLAVIHGYMGKKSAFIRTPKFNIKSLGDELDSNYLSKKWDWNIFFEGLLALYFLFAIGIGIKIQDYSMLLFHITLVIGYGTIFFYSIRSMNFLRN